MSFLRPIILKLFISVSIFITTLSFNRGGGRREVTYLCQLLDPVEAGNEGEGQVALRGHLTAQEEISLQIVRRKVVLTNEEQKREKN